MIYKNNKYYYSYTTIKMLNYCMYVIGILQQSAKNRWLRQLVANKLLRIDLNVRKVKNE